MKNLAVLSLSLVTLSSTISAPAFASEYFTALSNRGNLHCHEVENPSNAVWVRYRAELENEARVNAKRLAREAGYRICEQDSVVVKRVDSANGGTICAIEMTLICGN